MSEPLDHPFHPGERAVQARFGLEAKLDQIGRRAIRPSMSEQHREFFEQLPFLLLGAADAAGQPWATILVGRPGFAHAPDPTHLAIAARLHPGDPLLGALAPGAAVGLLGIELPTRRRNRMNGTIAATDGLTVEVQQSFGNCPKYIQTRAPRFVAAPDTPPQAAATCSDHLSGADRALIAAADTFFIATSSGGTADGIDISHRGGLPGFVRIDDDRGLTTPDFAGNFFFNTLGNLALDPRAGLLFIDWDTGDLLHLSGDAEIVWDGPEVQAFAGAQRLVRFRLHAVVRRRAALPLRAADARYSPFLAATGTWPDVSAPDAQPSTLRHNVA